MQVLNFLDEYSKLCDLNGYKKSATLVNTLQQALDSGEDVEEIRMNGNSPDFRGNRINDNYFKLNLVKPLNSASFIKSLDLSYNELTDDGAEIIAEFLRMNTSLRELNITSNNFTGKGAIDIAQALQVNEFLDILHLSNNEIGDEGGMAIAAMLQVNINLNELSVAGCSLGSQSLVAISSVLQANTILDTLDISNNKSSLCSLTQSTTNSVFTHLSRMIKFTETLKNLNMSKLGITDWVVVDHLADSIQQNSSLLHLDLSGNRIGQDGGIYIAAAIEKNEVLEELKLSHCAIQEAGAKCMMKMLEKNQTLRRLYLDHNDISDRGLCFLAAGIQVNKNLETIHLWGNHFNKSSAEEFAKLTGGIQTFVNIGNTADKLTEDDLKIIQKANLAKNYIRVADILGDKEGLQAPKQDDGRDYRPISRKDNRGIRLKSSNLDVRFYNVEGVPYAAAVHI